MSKQEKSDHHEWASLPHIAESENFPLRKHNGTLSSSRCPSPRCGDSSGRSNKLSLFLGKDAKWRFNCFACGVYGDTADFIAMVRGISAREAMDELDGGAVCSPSASESPRKTYDAAVKNNDHLPFVKEVCAILREKALADEPRAYLRQRGILDATIDMAVDTGQLRFLPGNPEGARRWLDKHVGATLMRQAGLLKKDGRWPALAFKPILAIDPSASGFECRVAQFEYEGSKTIRYGRMRWPWYFTRRDTPATVLVTEGIIDSLSGWQCLPEADAFMPVPGVNGWRREWFEAFHRRNPSCCILVGFDEDAPGREGNEKLAALLNELSVPYMSMPPPSGKDWNEYLASQVSVVSQSAKPAPSRPALEQKHCPKEFATLL